MRATVQNPNRKRRKKASGVPKEPHKEDGVSRMQFLLELRRRGINDVAVLRALDDVARERFVDDRFADDAYADRALPIACGQTISQPFVVAYMTEQLGVRPEHKVLEVGTGSGYQGSAVAAGARSGDGRALSDACRYGARAPRCAPAARTSM
jgi:hypothetical protein